VEKQEFEEKHCWVVVSTPSAGAGDGTMILVHHIWCTIDPVESIG
jgi:hypothetical protein